MSKIIRVVPPLAGEYGDGYPTRCFGTKVYVGDEAISIQKITLIAEPRNVWRAIIETTVQVDGEIAAVVRDQDQDQATPAPAGSQCGDEPSKPRNWIGSAVDWITCFLGYPGYWRTPATHARVLAAIRERQRLEKERPAAGTVTHMDGLPTLTLPRMEMTREMVVEDQRRAARMAEHDQRHAARVAEVQSLACTIDIERQAKEACDSLVEALKADHAMGDHGDAGRTQA